MMQDSSRDQSDSLESIGMLLTNAACTHLVSMDNPGQTFHIRRSGEMWEFLVPGNEPGEVMISQPFESVADFRALTEALHLPQRRLTSAVWCDISSYPEFPLQTLYRPFQERIELQLIADDDSLTTLGVHKVFGPVNIVLQDPNAFMIEPREGWLIVEYPSVQIRYKHSAVYQPSTPSPSPSDSTASPESNSYSSIPRHSDTPTTHIHPAKLIAYGKPPRDWSAHFLTVRHASHHIQSQGGTFAPAT